MKNFDVRFTNAENSDTLIWNIDAPTLREACDKAREYAANSSVDWLLGYATETGR